VEQEAQQYQVVATEIAEILHQLLHQQQEVIQQEVRLEVVRQEDQEIHGKIMLFRKMKMKKIVIFGMMG